MEQKRQTSELPFKLEAISGQRIEQSLINLAKIGGTQIPGTTELPERYAVNRVALSEADFQARELLSGMMTASGITDVIQHPLGLIGYYPGEDPSLTPIIIESHFDSVPKAGMYDGTVGVMTGLEVLTYFKENNVKTKRPIVMVALTGEESSGFNMALFGSKGIALGLTDEELNQKKEEGLTIRQALQSKGQDIEAVKKPFGLPIDAPVIEVHVSQDDRLEKSKSDLAIVENIAAPRRFKIEIGEKLQPVSPKFDEAKYFDITVAGKAGHSGATPMGEKNRADGFVVTSDFLTKVRHLQKKFGESIEISIAGLTIEGQALNKIPGEMAVQIRVGGTDAAVIAAFEKDLMEFTKTENTKYTQDKTAFNNDPIKLKTVDTPDEKKVFYNSETMLHNYAVTGLIVKMLNMISNRSQYLEAKNVATVSTFNIIDGQISLGVDIRGIDKSARDEMVTLFLQKLGNDGSLKVDEQQGSGDPVAMNKHLVDLAEQVIKENNIGSVERTNSPAGHDAQNFARAGHPSIMLFIPSRNGGIAHTPEEYSTPTDLQKGAQALAALVYNLAIEI